LRASLFGNAAAVKNTTNTNRTIKLNAVMLPGTRHYTDAAFMGFDTFHFIQFIVLTVLTAHTFIISAQRSCRK
jgi:hypothetical protein